MTGARRASFQPSADPTWPRNISPLSWRIHSTLPTNLTFGFEVTGNNGQTAFFDLFVPDGLLNSWSALLGRRGHRMIWHSSSDSYQASTRFETIAGTNPGAWGRWRPLTFNPASNSSSTSSTTSHPSGRGGLRLPQPEIRRPTETGTPVEGHETADRGRGSRTEPADDAADGAGPPEGHALWMGEIRNDRPNRSLKQQYLGRRHLRRFQ